MAGSVDTLSSQSNTVTRKVTDPDRGIQLKRTKLKFNKAKVAKALSHSESCNQRSWSYDQLLDQLPEKHWFADTPEAKAAREAAEAKQAPTGVWLVADEGVYIMSNGTGTVGKTTRSKTVAYAHGHRDYEAKRAAVGGDDFQIYVEAEIIQEALDHIDSTNMTLVLWEDRMGFLYDRHPDAPIGHR